MSLLDDVKRARGEDTRSTSTVVTPQGSQINGSLLDKVRTVRGEVVSQPVKVSQPSRTDQIKEKVGGFLGQAYQYLWGDNERILQLSEDDVVKRMNVEQQKGADTSKLFNTLKIVQKARRPDASLVEKYGTGTLMRIARAGTQLATGAVGFGASVLDTLSQQTEQMIELDRQKAEKLKGTPMGEYYKAKLPKEGEDTTNWFREKSKSLKKYVEDHSVSNPTFADLVSQGSASMAGFALMNFATGPQGAVVSESLIESANTYETLRNEGKSFEESTLKADASLLGNLVLNHFLNIFEMDDKQVGAVRKLFEGAGKEGVQEGLQQVISNLTTGRPITEGVLESAGVGGVLGGVTVFTLPGAGGQQIRLEEVGSVETRKEEKPDLKGLEPVKTEMVKYKSAEDYASTEGTTVDKQIGVISSNNIQVRDPVDVTTAEYKSLYEDIKVNGVKEPVIVEILEDGTIRTTEGSHRVTIAKDLGLNVPVIVTKGKLEGLNTIKEMFESVKSEPTPKEETYYHGTNKTIKGQLKPTTDKSASYGSGVYLTNNQNIAKDYGKNVIEVTASPNLKARTITEQERQNIVELYGKEQKDYIDSLLGKEYNALRIPERNGDGFETVVYDPSVIQKKEIEPKKEMAEGKAERKEAKEPAEKKKETKKPSKTKKSPEKKPTKPPKTVKKKTQVEKTTSDQDIIDYVDKKGVKFRLDSTENNEKVTIKFLQHPDIEGKETAGYQFIENLAKSTSLNLKQKEREIIQDVLVKNFAGQKQINMAEFKRAIIGQLMPLEAIQTNTYADYGSDNLGGNYDSTTTYILNSGYNHGVTGHFYSDFKKSLLANEVEVKEIPESEQNPRAKWAVVRKGVELTRENIEENVLTVATSEKLAQDWVVDHLRGPESDVIEYNVTEGLFSHFRSFDVEQWTNDDPDAVKIAHIAEAQSDAFQHLERIDERKDIEQRLNYQLGNLSGLETKYERIKLEDRTDTGAKGLELAEIKDQIDGLKKMISGYEQELKEFGDLPKEASQFLSYKNIWHERTVREAITIKAREGFDLIRFPTPRTVAVIEGFVGGEGDNRMPYEIVSANDDQILEVGDTIEYGGEELTVVQADNYSITVAPSKNVNSFSDSDFRQEEANALLEDLQYEVKKMEEVWGEVRTPEKAQQVLDSVSVLDQLAKYTNKKEVLRYVTDTTKQSEERIAEIKSFKSPDPKLLKGIPKSAIEDAKRNTLGYSLGNEKMYLQTLVEQEEGEYSLEDFEEDFLQRFSEDDPDYKGMFSEVFFVDDGYDQTVYVITEGNSEQFGQPDQYDQAKSIEDFDIEDFSGNERTVLDFYDKQLNRYLQKLRKGNLELVTDDNGYEWWETKVTKDDIRPPTAYRLQEDLEKVGIKITQEQEQEILDLNKQIFGDANVKVVGQILAGNKALGVYSDRIIKILDKQADPKDTYYHEAVHKYLDIFTSRDEYIEILKEGRDRYNISNLLQVEEKIAEDFIDYANRRKGVTGKIKAYFDKVLARIKSYMGNKSTIDSLYADIVSGKARVRASKVAVSIEQKVEGAFDNIAGYEQINVKDQARRASDLITSDIDRVRRIIAGELPLPDGLRAGMLIKGVEEYAYLTNDIDLVRSLAVSPLVAETSIHAQELRLLAERDENSVLSRVQSLASERAKIVQRRYGTVEKAIKKETEKIKKEVKINKYDWNSFINSIEC